MKEDNVGFQVELLHHMRGKPQERALVQLPGCFSSDARDQSKVEGTAYGNCNYIYHFNQIEVVITSPPVAAQGCVHN